ncbi:GTP-binding protein ypt2 isoform X2 [Nematostella vectensis]|uniref:GTP-binding protein ypt2 isoform X2 n=1 Tax=Nematostella vectensis TaxID=45351 RepID=UPI00139019EF|nr:GTP-binding protein ypt2 isoform X2 [Nematostella vectensis]
MASNSQSSPEKDFEATYKILVLGDSGVGKTCLIFRFAEDIFSDSYISTIGIDCRSRVVDLDGQRIRLQIWDTAGQERFRTLTSAYYRGAMGILLVYDITTEDSFKHISQWLQNIEDNASPNVCKVLLGNKLDAEDERVIDAQRGRSVGEDNNLEFYEASARTGENVQQAFMAVARKIKEQRERQGMRFQYNEGFAPITGEEEKTQSRGCCGT